MDEFLVTLGLTGIIVGGDLPLSAGAGNAAIRLPWDRSIVP